MSFSRRRLWALTTFSCAMVVLMVLTACGGDDATATPAPTATRPAATTAPTAAPTSAGSTAAPTATRPVATAAVSPTAPAPTATTAPKAPAGTLSIVLPDIGPEVFAPRITSGQESSLLHLVTDPLIAINSTTRALEGRLVQSWSYSKVGTDNIWSFKIMPGAVVNEANGAVWNSEDVKWNFEEFLKPDARNSIAPPMRLLIDSDLKNFETVSPTEFKLHSTKFDASSMRSISFGNNFQTFSPASHKTVGDAAYSGHPNGTGSYIFKTGQKGSKYTFDAVNNHWRKTSNVQSVTLLVAPDVATRLAMLKTGQADMGGLDKPSKAQLSGNLRPYAIQKQALAFVALGGQYYDTPAANCTTCPWVGSTDSALKVRQAMAYAIDRKAIIDKLLFGEATPAAAPFDWMPGPYAHVDQSWEIPAYDPAKAKTLLTQAGYPNGFNIELAIITTATFVEGDDTAEAVAGYWEAIGIKVKRTPMDFTPTFRDKMANRTTAGFAWILANNIKDEPLPDMRNLFSKGGAIAYLHDAQIDDFIAKASVEVDDAKRAEMGKALGKYLVDSRIGLPLFGVNGMWGVSAKVKNWDNIAGVSFLNNVETITLS